MKPMTPTAIPTRRILLAALLLALAGCGADGPPVPPTDTPHPEPGVTVSGTASVGVVGGSG